MQEDQHEMLSHGLAGYSTSEDDEDQLNSSVRVMPIGEGDITEGSSGERVYWDKETLQSAVESGVFDGTEIIKGRGGDMPHFPMDEHVPPENKLGRVENWEYEDGVGPVGHTELADDNISDRIELGLLDISADMLRLLGDYDEEMGAYQVDSILSVPRITVLDKGASGSASIEPSTVEALGLNPDKIMEHDIDDSEGMYDKFKSLFVEYFGQPPNDETNVYINKDESIKHADMSESEEKDEDISENTNMTDPKIEELQEKLAEKKSEISDFESQIEELNAKIDDLESDMTEKEEEIDGMSDDIESKDDEIEQLQEFVEPVEEMLAGIIADGSEYLSAEHIAEKHDLPELVDMLAGSADDDENKTYTEKVREQLSQNIKPRGDANASPDEMSDEEYEQLEDMAQSAMTARDMRKAEQLGLSSVEFLKETKNVDPAEVSDERQLRQRIAAKKGE